MRTVCNRRSVEFKNSAGRCHPAEKKHYFPHSTNALFSSVKDDSLRELSEEVSEALGADGKIKLVCEKKTAAEETEQSAVNALLKKAEALGIDVIRK